MVDEEEGTALEDDINPGVSVVAAELLMVGVVALVEDVCREDEDEEVEGNVVFRFGTSDSSSYLYRVNQVASIHSTQERT